MRNLGRFLRLCDVRWPASVWTTDGRNETRGRSSLHSFRKPEQAVPVPSVSSSLFLFHQPSQGWLYRSRVQA